MKVTKSPDLLRSTAVADISPDAVDVVAADLAANVKPEDLTAKLSATNLGLTFALARVAESGIAERFDNATDAVMFGAALLAATMAQQEGDQRLEAIPVSDDLRLAA